MPNTSEKEKLVELVCKICAEKTVVVLPDGATHKRIFYVSELVDELLAHGVTFATDNNVGDKWISVKDRLPDVAIRHNSRWEKSTESVRVLCVCKQKSGKRMVKEGCCKVYANGFVYWAIPGAIDSVTHWMPLPPMPKGE